MTDTPTATDEILDEDLEIVSMAGRILGSLRGRLHAGEAAFNTAHDNGAHDELQLAGLCRCEVRGPEPVVRPKVVVLCGSTRFYDAFQQANYDETMAGRIVLSVGFYPHAKAAHGHGEGVGHDSAEKVALDELHKRKIDLADEVLVLNVGGYIGDSTRSEIAYAQAQDKVIRWLEPAAEAQRLLDEVSAKPFVACKAPDPLHPNQFCLRRLDHDGTCWYADAGDLPPSADDEGDPAQARLDERDTDDSCPYCRSGPAGHVCTTAHGLLAHAAEAPQENRCAYCSEVIVRFADTGVWRHQIVPASTLLDHPATPANLADDAAQGGGPF